MADSMPANGASELLSSLTERQRQAVVHTGGPLLIVAGPGSGKTRVMAHRVAYLIREVGVRPHRVLAVTFTNKAARELRLRCERLVGGDQAGLHIRTFHSFCSQLLRIEGGRAGLEQGFSIYDDDDQVRLMKQILESLEVDIKQHAPRAVLSAISDAKNNLVMAGEYDPPVNTYFEEIVGRAYAFYEERLRTANAVDFDDLLLITHRLLENNIDLLDRYQERFEHLLVDEFQDTNPIQLGLARLLAGKHRNICVVGDPNQSIYSWRHADPRNMLDFKKYYKDATIVTLDQNYRSTQTIIEASAALIANNEGRLHNDLWTDNQRGAPITIAEAYNEEEEAELVLREAMRLRKDDGVRYGDIAIMYRINAQSRAMEVACNRHGQPYQLVGGLKFYDRKEIRDLIAYLRVIANPADNIAIERIINTPARGISQRTIDAARQHAEAYGVSLWEGIDGIENADHELNSALNKRAVNSVIAFVDQMKFLADRSHQLSVVELIDVTLERSGYKRLIQEDTDRGEERWDNLLELRGTAEPFDGPEPRAQLLEFLENAALVSDVDRMKDADESEQITLITLHQAKGLEFDTVFMIGVEEGMLPHSRSLESAAELEEERRLCYVGMTRAEKRLYMLRAFNRSFRGMRGPTMSSRFLDELPEKFLQRATSASMSGSGGEGRTPRGSAARNVTRTGIDPSIRTPMQRRADLARPASAAAARPTETFKPGEQVTHLTFGEGIILGVEESGGDSLLTVVFKTAGQKKLSASYAPLTRLTKPAMDSNNGGARQDLDQTDLVDAG